MSKQLSLSATFSALSLTLLALAVSVGSFQEKRSVSGAQDSHFAIAQIGQ